MDIKKSKLNVCVSVAFKIITMVMAVAVKMALVKICGNEVNGLNALFISIIGFLAVADLGVGSAITFCMYKPIVDGDKEVVSALYHLFQRLYMLIGSVIFAGGIIIMPFLPRFAKDYAELDVNMYITFLLVLISVTLTYLFSAKTSLINAYKNNYITTAITQGGTILQYALQITVLFLTNSFVCYLVCRIIAVAFQWILTEFITRKKHRDVLKARAKLDEGTKALVKKNIKAMFMHKIGFVLVNTVDSIVISAFVGVVSLGEYSNYTLILSSMTGIITLIFTSLTSVIGHVCAKESRETAKKYCESFHLLNFIIGTVFFLGYYAVVDSMIAIMFSSELIVDRSISFVITLNGFVQFMRRSTLTFKDATGAFYGDRWKPLCEGIVNIVLSVLLVKVIGVVGVIVATIITNLVICHTVEPYVLYKDSFGASVKRYYAENYFMIAVFGAVLFGLDRCLFVKDNRWLELFANAGLSMVLSAAVIIFICLLKHKSLRGMIELYKSKS